MSGHEWDINKTSVASISNIGKWDSTPPLGASVKPIKNCIGLALIAIKNLLLGSPGIGLTPNMLITLTTQNSFSGVTM